MSIHGGFTATSTNGLWSRIIVPCEIILHDKSWKPVPIFDLSKYPHKALWDTGATQSVISVDLANQLDLTPIGYGYNITGSGKEMVPIYMIDFQSLGFSLGGMQVSALPGINGQGFDMLVGMDIISQGDFLVSNANGVTKVSFRTPSIDDGVAFNHPNMLPTKSQPVRNGQKIGRNEPCPCGSGLKYKNCYLKSLCK